MLGIEACSTIQILVGKDVTLPQVTAKNDPPETGRLKQLAHGRLGISLRHIHSLFSALSVPHMLSGLSSNDPPGKQMMGDICRQFNGRGLG